MKRIAIALAALATFSFATAAEDVEAAPGYDIFLVGPCHSECVGLGTGTFRILNANEDSRIFQLGRNGADNLKIVPVGCKDSAGVVWDCLQHWKTKPLRRLGPALQMARDYARLVLKPNRKVLIVPTACVGLRVTELLNYEPHRCESTANLMADMRDRARLALATPGGVNRLVGVIMLMGENDLSWGLFTGNVNSADYRDYILKAARDVRRMFAGHNYKLIMSNFADATFPGEPEKINFENANRDAAAADPNSCFVSKAGLKTNGQLFGTTDTHLSADAQVSFGRKIVMDCLR